ncbi:MAG TPA: hypothetical protein ENI33_04175 [Thermoplasmatales archaeon]|nr:hypothetical protein [Thermoplasmatales archaeon]
MKKLTILLFILFVAIPLNALNENGKSRSFTDIATWCIGDAWTYDMDIYSSSENGSFDGTINNLIITVYGVTTIELNNATYDVYWLNLTGNVNGTISYSFISGDIEGNIYGEMFVRRADLSDVYTNIVSYGTIHYLLFDYDYELNITSTFFPPAEHFDFPLLQNESWNYYYNSKINGYFKIDGLLNETINSSEYMEGELTCNGINNISVPAGVFYAFHIADDNETYESWYSSAAKNVIKSNIRQNGNTTYNIHMNMTSYSLNSQQINISLELNPQNVSVGENINLSGNAVFSSNGEPVSNNSVLVELPIANKSWITSTDESGFYYLNIEAPFFIDYTPSINEIGSDGIIVSISYNIYSGYKVKTLILDEIKHSFSLSKGWNLITLPVENNYTASSLYADIPGCNIILSWNASIADFDLYAPGVPNDFVIENGTGYLIGVENDTFLNITGMPIESVAVPLYIGWNMLGWFNSTPTNASSLLNSIPECNIVLKWNNSKEDFDLYAPGVPNNFIIKQGEGFLVAVDEQSIWHG